MTVATMGGVHQTRAPSTLADVLDVILDKGIVIDVYVRVSVIGIELLTIEARIVIASVDTYIRFAEAMERLALQPALRREREGAGLPQLLQGVTRGAVEGGARAKTRGALSGVKETASELVESFRGGADDRERRVPVGREPLRARGDERGN